MMVSALGVAGLSCGLQFNSVGENGKELVKILTEDGSRKISGEAILRVDDRYRTVSLMYPMLTKKTMQTHTPPDIFITFFLDCTPPSSDAGALLDPSTRPAAIR
jgi:hypothetical protein